MFRINPNPTFQVTVKVPVAGQETPALLPLTFRHKGRDALIDWVNRAHLGANGVEVLAEVIAGWDVQDENGEAVPFSDDALKALLNGYHEAPLAIFRAYAEQMPEFRAKN